MEASSPQTAPGIRYAWAARGDINAFFGLMLDNLSDMILMTGLLVGVFGMPAGFVMGRMIPGTAVGVMVGDLIYTVMAFRLARRSGRADVTAMPLGLDTPSTFGAVFLILGPAFVEATRRGLTPEAAAKHAWFLGIAMILASGVFKLACAPFSGMLRKIVPRAGLLGSLAAIALVIISFLPLLEIAGQPVADAASRHEGLAFTPGRAKAAHVRDQPHFRLSSSMQRTPFFVAALLASSLCLLSAHAADNTTGKRPFTFEDLMAIKRVGEPVPSPDGLWVVFAATDVNLEANTKRSHLWIVPAGGGEARRLNPDTENDESRPRFSPTGNRLIFTAKVGDAPQIWTAAFNPSGTFADKPHPLTALSTGADGAIFAVRRGVRAVRDWCAWCQHRDECPRVVHVYRNSRQEGRRCLNTCTGS